MSPPPSPVKPDAGPLRRLARALLRPMWRAVVPPSWRRRWHERSADIRWRGNFKDWNAVLDASRGYEDPDILERVAEATRAARGSDSVFERDGVLLLRPAPDWLPLSRLRELARTRGGRLRVIDFGGALGSLYFQHEWAWREIPYLSWRVVEQAHFVELGRREFADGRLAFFPDLQSATADGECDVVIASAVVHYLSEPWRRIDDLLALGAPVLLLDRTPVIESRQDRLTLQTVSGRLGAASYPCWFLSRPRLVDALRRRYPEITDFVALDGESGDATFRGFYCECEIQ